MSGGWLPSHEEPGDFATGESMSNRVLVDILVLQHTGTAQQLLVPPTDKATSCYVPPTHPQNKAAANPLSRPQQQHPAATVLVRPQAFQLRGASLNACGLWPA
eukprot:scaffold41775_cov22-Tisochrysis_lutea.AAC.3